MKRIYLVEERSKKAGHVRWRPVGPIHKLKREAEDRMDVEQSWTPQTMKLKYRVTTWQKVERKKRARVHRTRGNGSSKGRISKRNISA